MMEVDLEHTSGSGVQAAISFLRSNPVYIFYILSFFLVLRFFKNRYASPLRHYPGPFLASGTRVWKLWVTWQTHQETEYINLHKKYGTLFPIHLSLRTSLPITYPFLILSLTPPPLQHTSPTDFPTRQAPSSASPPTNSPSPVRPLPAKFSPPAKASTRRPSTPSSRRRRTPTSSPKPASTCMRPRNAWPAPRTAWRRCRA